MPTDSTRKNTLSSPERYTAPANSNTGGNPKIIRVGIDSLYLSFEGIIYTETYSKLNRLKQLAQGLPFEKELAIYPIFGHNFEVWSKGSGRSTR